MKAVRGWRYRLVVRGELGDRFAAVFDGMQLERHEGTTVLTGSLRDQAQLHGCIEQIKELGLELVSVERFADPTAGDPPDGRSGKQQGT